MGQENRRDKRVSAIRPAPPGKPRNVSRVELQTHRLSATLAIVRGKTISGCVVPLKDFSKSGAGVYTKFTLDKHTPIRLSIDGVQHEPIEGKVVWCGPTSGDHQAPPTHPYRLGIEFTPKDDDDRENLIRAFELVSKLIEG